MEIFYGRTGYLLRSQHARSALIGLLKAWRTLEIGSDVRVSESVWRMDMSKYGYISTYGYLYILYKEIQFNAQPTSAYPTMSSSGMF